MKTITMYRDISGLHHAEITKAFLKGLVHMQHLGITLTFVFFFLLLLFGMTPEYCGQSTPSVVYKHFISTGTTLDTEVSTPQSLSQLH